MKIKTNEQINNNTKSAPSPHIISYDFHSSKWKERNRNKTLTPFRQHAREFCWSMYCNAVFD